MTNHDRGPQFEGSAAPVAGKAFTRRETIQRAGLLTLGTALGIPTAALARDPTHWDSRFQLKIAGVVSGRRQTLSTLELDERTADLFARNPESFRLDWYDREQSGSRPISSLRFDDRYQLKLEG